MKGNSCRLNKPILWLSSWNWQKSQAKIQYRNDTNCQSILKCLTYYFWISWLKYPFWKWLKNQYLMRLGSLVEMPQQCTLMARVAASAVQRIGIPLFLVSFKIPNRRSLGNKNQPVFRFISFFKQINLFSCF